MIKLSRRPSRVSLAIVALATVALACARYSPKVPEGVIGCSDDSACPNDQTCSPSHGSATPIMVCCPRAGCRGNSPQSDLPGPTTDASRPATLPASPAVDSSAQNDLGSADLQTGVDDARPTADSDEEPDAGSVADGPESQTNGLQGDYFSGLDFDRLVFTRIDQTIDFNWKDKSPDPRLPADKFSVRWTGSVEARYSEPYTFTTVTDDGVRLWIDGAIVVDAWVNQSQAMHNATVTLVAGRRIPIRMDFYERAFTAAAHLSWSSASQPAEVVPYTRLFTP
jgi:hypothetical protein